MNKEVKAIKDQINFLLNRIDKDTLLIRENLSDLFNLNDKEMESDPKTHNLFVVKVKESEFDQNKNFIEIHGLFRELDNQNKVIFQNTKIRLRRERYYLASMVNNGYEIRASNTLAIVHPNFFTKIENENND